MLARFAVGRFITDLTDNMDMSLNLTAPGTNYTAPPTVTVAPPQAPDGVRAVFTALINQAGQVTGFQQVVAGSGYTSAPAVTIGAPALITAGNATTFTANGTAKLNTKTKSLAGTLSGVGSTLQVTEADDLAIGTVALTGGGTASITTGFFLNFAIVSFRGGFLSFGDRPNLGGPRFRCSHALPR